MAETVRETRQQQIRFAFFMLRMQAKLNTTGGKVHGKNKKKNQSLDVLIDIGGLQ